MRGDVQKDGLGVLWLGAACAVVGGALVALWPWICLAVAVVFGAGFVLLRTGLSLSRRLVAGTHPDRRADQRLDTFQYIGLASLFVALGTISWNGVRVAPGLTASDPFLVLAAAAWFASPRSTFRLASVPLWIRAAVYVLGLAILASALTGLAPVGDAAPGIRLGVAMTLTPLVIGFVGRDSGALGLMIDVWLASIAVNAMVGVLDAVAGTSIGASFTGVETIDRAAGLTTQVNHLGIVTAMAVPFAFSRVSHATSSPQRLIYATIIVAIVMGCFVSGSRAGVLGVVAGLAVLPLLHAKASARTSGWIVVVGVVVCVLVLAVPGDRTTVAIERLTGSSSALAGVSESDRERSIVRRDAIDRIRESPVIGSGFGELRRAHSVYLQLYAAGGVLGIAVFLIFGIGAIRSGWRSARSSTLPPAIAGIAAAGAASILAWMVMAIQSNQLFDRYLFVPAGMILAVRLIEESGRFSRSVAPEETAPPAASDSAASVHQSSSPISGARIVASSAER